MNQEQLKQKIAEYFGRLPKEAQEVFSSMEWMDVLKKIGTKYNINPKEIETLGTETTLVLLGIISIDEYYDILNKELSLEENIKNSLIKEIDESILKEIKNQLMNTFESNVSSLADSKEDKPLVYDPRFSNMPKDVQEAIAHSKWKENLYKIAQKYKLSIIQMGDLEDITVKVIANEIHPDKYESEVAFRIIIPKNDISNLVNDVNEDILMDIRKSLRKEREDKTIINDKSQSNDEIPLPPYAKPVTGDKLQANDLEKKPIEVPKKIEVPEVTEKIEEIQIPKPVTPVINSVNTAQKELENIIKTIPFPTKKDLPTIPIHEEQKKEEIKPIEPTKITPQIPEIPIAPKNIMDDKLSGVTVSNQAVSDYSTPKISTPSSHSNDPYREEI